MVEQTDVCEYKTQKTDTVKMLYVGDPQIGASKGQTQNGAELTTDESGAANTAAENDGFSWNRTSEYCTFRKSRCELRYLCG